MASTRLAPLPSVPWTAEPAPSGCAPVRLHPTSPQLGIPLTQLNPVSSPLCPHRSQAPPHASGTTPRHQALSSSLGPAKLCQQLPRTHLWSKEAGPSALAPPPPAKGARHAWVPPESLVCPPRPPPRGSCGLGLGADGTQGLLWQACFSTSRAATWMRAPHRAGRNPSPQPRRWGAASCWADTER